jgi:hypothetical protein
MFWLNFRQNLSGEVLKRSLRTNAERWNAGLRDRILHSATIDPRTMREVSFDVANCRLLAISLPTATSMELSFVDATMGMQPSQRIVAETAHNDDAIRVLLVFRCIRIVDLNRSNAGIKRQIIVRGPAIVDDLFRLHVRSIFSGERDRYLAPPTDVLQFLLTVVQGLTTSYKLTAWEFVRK